MSGLTKTYDPKQIVVTFNGVPIVGFADGTFISVSPSGDRFTKTVGADGEVGRSKSNDNTSEVTITLLQTSLSNDYLNSQMLLDKLTNSGKGTLQIKDMAGTSVHFWKEAWIKTPPDGEYSKEISERSWVFDTGQADIEVFGGNF